MGRAFHTAVMTQFLAMVFVCAFLHSKVAEVCSSKDFTTGWSISVEEHLRLANDWLWPAPPQESRPEGDKSLAVDVPDDAASKIVAFKNSRSYSEHSQ